MGFRGARGRASETALAATGGVWKGRREGRGCVGVGDRAIGSGCERGARRGAGGGGFGANDSDVRCRLVTGLTPMSHVSDSDESRVGFGVTYPTRTSHVSASESRVRLGRVTCLLRSHVSDSDESRIGFGVTCPTRTRHVSASESRV
jgi:hypothetical protein